MANRITGFEGVLSGYTAPDVNIILAAPTGSKKFVVVGLHVVTIGTATFDVVKAKGATDSHIVRVVDTDEKVVQDHTGYITLDATDEILEIHTVSGSADISYSGSYLDID